MTAARWQRIREICDEVLGCEPGERSARLDALCAGDAALRVDVAAAINAVERGAALPGRPWPPPEVAADTLSRPGQTQTSLPQRIGSYRILRLIGEGGMGIVYAAQQDEPRRIVALKVIRPGLAGTEVLRRFRLESQALARLQHPGIAQIYEAGTAETAFGPQPYFAMEYIHGEPLTAYATRHRLPVRDRLELMIRICDAVSHAHQRGLIHRDLKPTNILVDESGQPKILDFGVARLTDSDLQRTQQTDLGELVGTLAYMSPEQVLADPWELDTRSDVYALGVVLYELLAGRLPHTAGARIHEVIDAIQHEEPKRLSSVSPLFRGDLETIAAKALEKDKARRYASASALGADIRRHLQNEPIAARPASAAYQLQKFARRHRALVAAVAAVFVVLVAGTIATAREAVRARRAEQVATAVSDFLRNDLLAQAGASAQATADVRPDPDLKVRVALERAAARIEGKFTEQPEVEASIRSTIGKTYLDLSLHAEAEAQLARALQLRRDTLGPDHPDTLMAVSDLAGLHSLAGQWTRAESLAREALEGMTRVLGPAHAETISATSLLAQIYSDQGKFDQAEPLLANILATQRRTAGDRDPETMTSMNNLALIYRRLRKDAQAEQLYTEALALRKAVSGEEHPQTLLVMNNLGGLYLAQAKLVEAEALFVRLLELSRRALGAEHRTTLVAMNGLAVAYNNQGKLAEAEALNRSLLEVQERVMGKTHPATLASMNNLALVWWRQGRFSEAETLQLRILDVRRRDLGEQHPDTLSGMQNLGRVYRSQGRFDDADAMLARVVAARERALGADNPITLSARNDLGWLYRARGDYVRAEALLTTVAEAQRRIAGPDDPQLLATVENLAEVHRLAGQYEQAATLLTDALERRRRAAGNRSPLTTSVLAALGRVHLQQKDFARAQPLLSEALRNLEELAPDTWQRFHAQSLLGAALAGAGRYADGERLLLSGYEGLVQRSAAVPAEERTAVDGARQSIVQLYAAWRKPDRAAVFTAAR